MRGEVRVRVVYYLSNKHDRDGQEISLAFYGSFVLTLVAKMAFPVSYGSVDNEARSFIASIIFQRGSRLAHELCIVWPFLLSSDLSEL